MGKQKKLALRKTLSLTSDYKPEPQQSEFHRYADTAKVTALFGGIRFGKSYAGALQALRYIYVHKLMTPPRGALVVPTYTEGKGAVERFREAAGRFVMQELTRDHVFLLYPPSGCEAPAYTVEVRTADNPNYLRSQNYAWVWLDEARDMSERVFQVCLGRILDTRGKLILTTTPAGKVHWLYQKFVVEANKHPDWKMVRAQTYDQPRISAEDIMELEKEYGPELAAQELRGEFVDLQGLVYPMMERDRHVYSDEAIMSIVKDPALEKDVKIYCGVDFGYGHYFICLWIAAVKDLLLVVDEYAAKYKTAKEHAKAIVDNPLSSRVRRYYCDPNALQSRMELQAAGVPLVLSPRIPGGSEKRGEELVRVRLLSRLFNETGVDGKPKLRISEKCPILLRQLSLHRFDRNGYPQRFNDDAPDALGYALRGIVEYGMEHSALSSRAYSPGEEDDEAWEELAQDPARKYDELRRGVPGWMISHW